MTQPQQVKNLLKLSAERQQAQRDAMSETSREIAEARRAELQAKTRTEEAQQ